MDPAAWDFGTAELSLEQEAAYLRIVNAIHKHDAPVPNNDRVLAGLFRTSTRKARALVQGLIDAKKLSIEDDKIWNERARSDMVHRQFVSGSASVRGSKGGRTRAENASKSLENIDVPQATASSRIEENRIEVAVAAREAAPIQKQEDPTTREMLLAAMGADPVSGMIGPNGTRLGTSNDMAIAAKWLDVLSVPDQCRLIAERTASIKAKSPDFAPRSFGYFSGAIADLVAAKTKPLPEGRANSKQSPEEIRLARWHKLGRKTG